MRREKSLAYPNLKSEFPSINCICVDCFDTLLHRTCSPDEVLNRFFSLLALKINVSEKLIRDAWKAGRKHLREMMVKGIKEEPSQHELISEIFQIITASKLQFTRPLEEFEVDFSNTMLEAEDQVVIVDNALVDWLVESKEAGKTIICVSDFYMSGEWLNRLLVMRQLPSLFDGVFVSSDVGLRKSTGRLFEFVRKERGCDSFAEMLMIGDNESSDQLIPANLGMQVFPYTNKVAKKKLALLLSKFQEIYKRNQAEETPFANYVFSLYLFCEKLYESLAERGIHEVWFFSREGMPLKSLFAEYLALREDRSMECHYVYVSRQATFLPSLNGLDEEDFYYLRCKAEDLSIRDFLSALGLQASHFESLTTKYDFDRIEKDFFYSEAFSRFKAEPSFVTAFDGARDSVKREARAYFQSQGLCDNPDKEYAVVDLGWKGSIQDCLSRIFDRKYTVCGFYYGLTGNVRIEENNSKLGLIFADYPVKSNDYGTYSINHRMLERILCANHGGCLTYDSNGPVLKPFERQEEELFEFVAPVQDRMLSDFKGIAALLEDEAAYGNKSVLRELAISCIHKQFALDWTFTRVRQMEYMDKRMDMNFAAFEKSQKNRLKSVFRRVLRGDNRIEMGQKLILTLYRLRLGAVANLLRKMFLSMIMRNW